MKTPDLECDLLLVGGGMVGAALAAACSGLGLTIVVAEGREPCRAWPVGEIDLRVSALGRASQRLLERLGAWDRMRELGMSPYREMRVWDAVGGASIHFDSADFGEPDLGHIVENRVTQLALWERLEAAPDIRLLCPARGLRLTLTGDRALLDLTDGRCVAARLLVGADGRDSWARARAGITTSGWDYDQQAIVANVRVTEPHRQTAWQRFLPTGPLAFLPLADGRCSIVWSATEDRARQLMALDDSAFRSELETAFERRLGAVTAIGRRAAFPLRLQHADQYVRPHLALIGDAAHALHPLAGQGVNLGFLDAAQLADNLAEALAKGRDIGGLWTLRRYERARRGENMRMLGVMEAFQRLFGNRNPLLVAARGAGLAVADRSPFLKRAFIEQALGLGEDLPRLARR
ncbi:MAG: UbiH/UbiF/VisC/COQ6 family ubiquinone biosynthesis hydroxylase [Chromatiaceae bacterium]|nr:UbiH/UbiF/VisC/COQ6 family ubiquinone biosynthesis hydroxylase [Chromatiaceae bacterium]